MKKIFKYLGLFLLLITITGCSLFGKYKEYAGDYEVTVVKMNGINYTSNYEYYTISLDEKGGCIVKSKGVGQSAVYEAAGTYEIKDGKIYIVTRNGAASVTEEYEYTEEGVIVMSTSINGVTIYGEFERAEEVEEE